MFYRWLVIWILLPGAAWLYPLKGQVREDPLLIVRNIDITGNKLTKEYVIVRELPFRIRDTIPVAELGEVISRSEDNLMNTSLFNFADLSTDIEGRDLYIHIRVVERWYIWPVPIFEHAERNFPSWLRNPEFSKLNYGIQVNWNNFRGRRELLEFKARFGYKEQFGLTYSVPNLGRNQQHGISFGINKFRQHEIIIGTEANQPLYYKDESRYAYETLSPLVVYTWRPGLYMSHNIALSWSDVVFRNDRFHEEYLGVPAGEHLRWFNLSYSADLDYRDYKAYPLKGYMLAFRLLQQGVGLVKDFKYSKTYLTLLGASHVKLLPRVYLGDVAKVRLTKDEKLPYYFREGIGYNTSLRGFEYYLIDGNSYFISSNSLKYAVIPGITHRLKWIPMEQFSKIHLSLYANLFFDFAGVRGNWYDYSDNNLVNKFLYSTGIGFDLVSYYDQVYRLEFTLNSLGETGIFLHLETPFNRW